MADKAAEDFLRMFSLAGRIALVTGGGSGIGGRIALALACAGAKVVISGRRRDMLLNTAQEINIACGEKRAAIVRADLSSPTAIKKAAIAAARIFGNFDILVNAAGINNRIPAELINWKEWQQTLNTNLAAPFFLSQQVAPGMIKKGFGAIINIGSMQSFRAGLGDAAYGASKGGVLQLTRALAKAYSDKGIIVNGIAPGFFPTQMTAKVFKDKKLAATLADKTLIGRNGALADIDGAAVFLASPAAAYITGMMLPVDGGFLAA